MNADDHLEQMLRSAVPPVGPAAPSRDLWPSIVNRGASRGPAVIDAAIAAVTILALLHYHDWLWLLAYHL